jgi:hypothetical protein
MITCSRQGQRGRKRRALAAQAGDPRRPDALTMEPARAGFLHAERPRWRLQSWVKVTAVSGRHSAA